MSSIDLDEFTTILFSRPCRSPNTIIIDVHDDDKELEIIFNILIRIILNGVFILYVNGFPWDNNDKYLGIRLADSLTNNSFNTVNSYLKSIGFIAHLDVTPSEVKDQKLSMCIKDRGRVLRNYHGYIIQANVDYDIYFDTYVHTQSMFNMCGMEV